jgi:hypothetical protein
MAAGDFSATPQAMRAGKGQAQIGGILGHLAGADQFLRL